MHLKRLIQKYLKFSIWFVVAVLILGSYSPTGTFVFAQSNGRENEIRNQIMDVTLEMERLQKEISQYSSLYNTTAKESQSLQNALKQLETNKKKLLSELALTQNKIKKTSLTIEDLSFDISDTERKISINSGALATSLAYLNRLEEDSSIETFLKYDTLSEALDYAMSVGRFQRKVNGEILISKDLRRQLLEQKQMSQSEKNKLENYQVNLADQKSIVEYNQKEKDKLLAITKNKEAEYQKALAERQRRREAFEKELFAYESELRLIIDPTSIPGERAGAISWPLSDIFITQYFGRTIDARRLYTSGTHNGIDFRAAIGTPVKAVLSGVVWGIGNTDVYPGCYSYGKWILIKHPNGLSSLYAHLSQMSVTVGQAVSTGDAIGYSGNTGYSTGPHLHLGIYATQGVRVEKYVSSNFCKNAVIPLADIRAYLDPVAYLPKL